MSGTSPGLTLGPSGEQQKKVVWGAEISGSKTSARWGAKKRIVLRQTLSYMAKGGLKKRGVAPSCIGWI